MWRELIPLGVVLFGSAALGLSFNALRPRDGIELGRAYFAAPPGPGAGPAAGAAPASARAAAEALAAQAGAEFQLVDADEVLRLVLATGGDPSIAVLIDARSSGHYRAGHLPGALQLDYFNVRQDIGPSLPFLRHFVWQPLGAGGEPAADQPLLPLLVVYCESDTCPDGYLLCRMLRDDYGVAAARLRLYLGGMQDWRTRQQRQVRGGIPW